MEVVQAIFRRRAYRSLEPVSISKKLIEDLARNAQLAPSCFNNQPWRFVFVSEPKKLREMFGVLTDGNRWATSASMIVVVFGRREDDCVIRDREYFQFDCGLASGFLILRATDLGLVAHPIAGFSPKKTREILGIPEDYRVITLIIVGKKSGTLNPSLSEKQARRESRRPRRKKLSEFVFFDRYNR